MLAATRVLSKPMQCLVAKCLGTRDSWFSSLVSVMCWVYPDGNVTVHVADMHVSAGAELGLYAFIRNLLHFLRNTAHEIFSNLRF
jgi:hypothetical protein